MWNKQFSDVLGKERETCLLNDENKKYLVNAVVYVKCWHFQEYIKLTEATQWNNKPI